MHAINGMGFGMGMGMGMGWIWILGLIVVGIIVWLIVRSATMQSGSSQHQIDSALDILKQRYAKGEIGKEEFEEKKKNLV